MVGVIMGMTVITLIVGIAGFLVKTGLIKFMNADGDQTNDYSGSNNIFWTKWVRGVCKAILCISAIVSIIIGGALIGILFNFIGVSAVLIGIIVIAVGIFISMTSYALIMMFSEISVNIYKSLNKEAGVIYNEFPGKAPYPAQTGNNALGESLGSENSLHKQNPHDFWVCRCGTRNHSEAKFCPLCGNMKQ